jgi:hypothetical protein
VVRQTRAVIPAVKGCWQGAGPGRLRLLKFKSQRLVLRAPGRNGFPSGHM